MYRLQTNQTKGQFPSGDVVGPLGGTEKSATTKLQKQYEAKLQQAIHMQRNGKIREYSFLTAEAEEIRAQMEALTVESKASDK